jgi:hypothetical protein
VRHRDRDVARRAVGQHPQRRPGQVVGQPVQRPPVVPGDQRLQDLLVLRVARRLPARRVRELVDADVADRPVRERLQLASQHLARAAGEQPVVVGVPGEPGREVAVPGRPPHRRQQPPGLLAARRTEAADRHGQGQRLHQDAAGVGVVQLLRVQARDPGPLVRLDLDQAFFLEHPQHLAQRRAADAELLGQRHLGQLGARRQRAVQDALAQVGVHVGNRLPRLGQVDLLDVGNQPGTGHNRILPDELRAAYSYPGGGPPSGLVRAH